MWPYTYFCFCFLIIENKDGEEEDADNWNSRDVSIWNRKKWELFLVMNEKKLSIEWKNNNKKHKETMKNNACNTIVLSALFLLALYSQCLICFNREMA